MGIVNCVSICKGLEECLGHRKHSINAGISALGGKQQQWHLSPLQRKSLKLCVFTWDNVCEFVLITIRCFYKLTLSYWGKSSSRKVGSHVKRPVNCPGIKLLKGKFPPLWEKIQFKWSFPSVLCFVGNENHNQNVTCGFGCWRGFATTYFKSHKNQPQNI